MPIGPFHGPVTWYGINYAGKQITQCDFQNKGKSEWTGKSSFVLKVPLRCLRPIPYYVTGTCRELIATSVSSLVSHDLSRRIIAASAGRAIIQTRYSVRQDVQKETVHLHQLSVIQLPDFILTHTTFWTHNSCEVHLYTRTKIIY